MCSGLKQNLKLFACSLLFVVSFGLIGHNSLLAQIDTWERQSVMVPMRDGKKLFTKIFVPKGSKEKLPVIMMRTPYGVGDSNRLNYELNPGGAFEYLIRDKYIFVFQDIRGKYRSEGTFVMGRPLTNDKDGIDEGTDCFDTIDWLVKNLPTCNGRVGVFGISYDGWLTVMAALKPHPALKAVSPQASPADQFLLDDFSHNGAFRLSPTFGYTYMVGTSNETNEFNFDQVDTYEWFLDLGPIKNAEPYLSKAKEGWIDHKTHPNYDSFWKKRSFLPLLKEVQVPTLNVVGWWDAEDFNGAMEIYEGWEQNDSQNQNFLAVGPWYHGAWWDEEFKRFGDLEFESDPSKYYREKIEAPFFKRFLHDDKSIVIPEAALYQTGANEWRTYNEWPVKEKSRQLELFLQSDGRIGFQKPAKDQKLNYTEYVSDPANPVPYVSRPIPGFWQDEKSKSHWKVADQRFCQYRPDVIHFETKPLEEDVVVCGEIVAKLFASTTGSDADWIVKLIDVFPEDYPANPKLGGFQLMVADEVLRGRYRNSFEKPEAIPSGKIVPFEIKLNNRHHRFRKGHRIMIHIQSSWFPLIDRNPQKYVNIFEANAEDYIKATHRIYHDSQHASKVTFPILQNVKPLNKNVPDAKKLTGKYSSSRFGQLVVKERNGGLVLNRTSGSTYTRLTHVQSGLFNGKLKLKKYRIRFLMNSQGKYDRLLLKFSDLDSWSRDYELRKSRD